MRWENGGGSRKRGGRGGDRKKGKIEKPQLHHVKSIKVPKKVFKKRDVALGWHYSTKCQNNFTVNKVTL